jgi:glycosyltransferase involved in cell wall biosynthesis
MRLKVAVVAYACNPRLGSESGVGWGWVNAIARYHDLWVITGKENRGDIEAELERRPELKEHLHFEYVHRVRYRRLENFGKPFYLHTYKHRWLPAAYERARELHARIKFDVAHQMTYIGFRFPGEIWKLDIPFVWGPIGGLEQTNWRLLPALGWKGAAYYAARNLLNDFDRRMRRPPRTAMKRASGSVIAATSGIANEIQRFYGESSVVIPEVGLPPLAKQAPSRRTSGMPLQLIWSGNHLPGKALPLLLRALSRLDPSHDWRLTVLGSGPCTRAWQRLSNRLGIGNRVRWTDQISRNKALEITQASHALVISSVYDLTSTVLVEALANGLPVICPDHCGFRDAIDESCGIKVPATSPSGLIKGLSRAVASLFEEPTRYSLALGAIRRSKRYAWEEKGAAVNAIYRRVTKRGQTEFHTAVAQPEPLNEASRSCDGSLESTAGQRV